MESIISKYLPIIIKAVVYWAMWHYIGQPLARMVWAETVSPVCGLLIADVYGKRIWNRVRDEHLAAIC